jgi:Short repeat of unknown function (DUF308)
MMNVTVLLAWPGPTALVLVLIVGVWAVIAGLVEFSAAFASGEPAGTRVMFILGGLVTVAFGVVLCARPGLGAVILALLLGLFNLTAGIWMLAQGTDLRHTGEPAPAATRPANRRRHPGTEPPGGTGRRMPRLCRNRPELRSPTVTHEQRERPPADLPIQLLSAKLSPAAAAVVLADARDVRLPLDLSIR